MDKYITVILTAYNRKQFLGDALNSVLRQTIPKELVQIIVIKNFIDEDLDKLIKENDGESIIVDECPVGMMLKEALEKSKGEVVSFLDDDDIFVPNKLEVILSYFKTIPDLIYFHNSQKKFSKQTEIPDILNTLKINVTETPIIFSTGKYFSKRLTKLLPVYEWRKFFFNLSSISIRKEYYKQFLNSLENITGHTDDFFFFNALNNNLSLKMIFSSEILTFYRLHNSTSQISNSDSSNLKKIRILEDFISSTIHVSRDIRNKELATILEYRLLSEMFERAKYNGDYTAFIEKFGSYKNGVCLLIAIYKIVTLPSFLFILRRYIHSQYLMRINKFKLRIIS